MGQRSKLAFLITIVTLVILLSQVVFYLLGESNGYDFTVWLTTTAVLAVVCVVFGWNASDWKQLLLFVPFPTLVMLIFTVTEGFFSSELSPDRDDLEDMIVGVFATFLISAFFFGFGFWLSHSWRWFRSGRNLR